MGQSKWALKKTKEERSKKKKKKQQKWKETLRSNTINEYKSRKVPKLLKKLRPKMMMNKIMNENYRLIQITIGT
jgi:polyribonucleotide nucleotidyltransferase